MKKGYRKCRTCGDYWPLDVMEKIVGLGYVCESCLEVEWEPYEEEIRHATAEEIDDWILYGDGDYDEEYWYNFYS